MARSSVKKSLWKVSISTTLEAEDAVVEMLGSTLNGTPSAYFDIEKQTNLVSLFSETAVADTKRVELRDALRQIRNCGLNLGRGNISIVKIRREDWAESWKRHFKPIEIGDLLLLKPSWSRKKPRKGQSVIVLDPGLSFGTGQHATTSFCLHEIARCSKFETSGSFLDIGTGSGILAIAATKLGYQPVQAFDFDPESVCVAKANAKINRVKFRIYRGDVADLPLKPRRQFNLICANLISNLLIAQRHKIAAQLKKDGVLVLAGILKSEFSQVQEAFENLGLKCVASRTGKEWRSGSFRFL